MSEKQVPIEKEVATIEKEVMTFQEKATAMVIDSPESNTEATEVLGMLTKKKKAIEEARKFFVDPLNAQVKAINAKFKPQVDSVDGIIQIIKGKVGAYHIAVEEARAKEQKRLDDIRAKADAKRVAEGKEVIAEPVRQVEEKQQTTKTETASATVKKVWKFRVTEYKELPDNIKVAIFQEAIKKGVADTVIRKFVDAGMHEITGVEVYQDTQVSVR